MFEAQLRLYFNCLVRNEGHYYSHLSCLQLVTLMPSETRNGQLYSKVDLQPEIKWKHYKHVFWMLELVLISRSWV